MDPITATTTLITLATFIKDLVEVGQSIKDSIEKVSENRRQIRELTNDVLRSLADLANLTRGHEDAYQAPALLGALGDLKADMLHVLKTCRKISPAERSPGFRGFGSQLKVWIKRNEVEAEIRHLKEHVINCYIKFTTFSTARNEQRTARIEDISLDNANTTLRVEQTVVVSHTENQVRLRRLEGMMVQVLLETPYGQGIANRTMDIISADPTHTSLESQYLSVQTMHLIETLQNLLRGGHFILDSEDSVEYLTTLRPFFLPPTQSSHVVHWVLGLVLVLQNSCVGIQIESMQDLMYNLGGHLANLGMISEAIAWELLTLQILEHVAGSGQSEISTLFVPWLMDSQCRLSRHYQHQLHYDLALQASEHAHDIWQSLSEHQRCTEGVQSVSTSMLVTHSTNLLETGQQQDAVTVAQKAVEICLPVIEQTIESVSHISPITPEAEYNAVISAEAFFILAKSLASVNHHIEAYEASKEGFQLVRRFSGSIRPRAGEFIDSFINDICKVAEEGSFSPTMLADNVILFRDLACHYPEEFSSQFLQLLYAYMYISGQDSPPASMEELRIFLEPGSNSPLPVLHTSSNPITHLSDFDAYGGVLDDVVWASYGPWNTEYIHIPLIKKIFITHFDQATAVIQEVISNLIADTSSKARKKLIFMLNDLFKDVLQFTPHPNQVVLSNIGLEIIGHLRQTPSILKNRRCSLPAVLSDSSWGCQLAGLLNEALATVDEAIQCHRLSFRVDSDDVNDVDELRWSHIRRAFILLDMARVSEAIEAAWEANTLFLLPSEETDVDREYLCILQTTILRRTARNFEAIQVLETFVSRKDPLIDGTFDLYFHFLHTELVAARKEVGDLEKAVHEAEHVVMACRKEVRNTDVENQKAALVHTLTVLSNCLATVGRNEEALVVAKEATLMYTTNAPHMWGNFLHRIRRQELGGAAFHSLSLCLTTSGQLAEALANAEKATELYHELVSLAPVHQPTLANSLQNLASILCRIGNIEGSISACREAVAIMRKVSESETYFLPRLSEALYQLSGYLYERGDIEGASSLISESGEIGRKFEMLPPLPPLFVDGIEDTEAERYAGEAEETLPSYAEVIDKDSPAVREVTLTDQLEPVTEDRDVPEEGAKADILTEIGGKLDTTDEGPINFRKTDVPGILSSQIEIKLTSTPMVIFLWILVGILGAALAVVQGQGQ